MDPVSARDARSGVPLAACSASSRRFAGVTILAAASLAGCALPWQPAPASGTTLNSTLTSMAAYQRVVAGARACYPWPSYKVEPDYFRPDTRVGAMKLFEMQDSNKLEMVSFTVSPTKDGSTINLKYKNLMSGFPSAAAAWLNGEPDRCPSR